MLYPSKPKGKPSEFPVYRIERDWIDRTVDGQRDLKDQVRYIVVRNGEITETFYTKREAQSYIRERRAQEAK